MAGPRFLVVDDASFIRDLLKKTLRNQFHNCTVSDASSAKKAQSLMRTQSFDMILSDWEMPEVTGEEFLRWVREQETFKEIPFIMVSSRGERDFVIQAVKAGVTDYIGKPFTPEDLVQKVTRAFKKVGKEELVKSALRPNNETFGGAFSSAGALGAKTISTSGEAQAEAAPKNDASATSPASNSPSTPVRKKPKSRAKGQAQLQFPGDQSEQCVIREVSLQALQGVLKRSENLPGLFDQVVISIVQNDGESVARLNGYVHSLSALENRIDCELLKIVIRFVDEDPEKLDQLSRFIAGK